MAAGGYKEFVAGETLDQDEINDYLMQGMLVFADSTARGSAITSPVEGQFSFLTSSDTVEFYDGSAWVALATDPPVGEVLIIGGGGGGGATSTNVGSDGSDSRFDILRSYGGGGGAYGGASGHADRNGRRGASGGGGGGASGVGGLGLTAQGSQGFSANGGTGAGGGGGGAGATGGSVSINGGIGLSSSITGSSVERAGGGGGGAFSGTGGTATGGGGAGGNGSSAGSNATSNTGGGGGGAGGSSPNNAAGGGGAGGHLTTDFIFEKKAYTVTVGGPGAGGAAGVYAGGNGGSGVVILKVPDSLSVAFSGGVTQSSAVSGDFNVYTITATSTTSETVTFS